MQLLKLGHQLICNYEAFLSQNGTIVGPDLRLLIYAIESTLLHREAAAKVQAVPESELAEHLLAALGDLRLKTEDYEAGRHNHLRLKHSLSYVTDMLTKYIECDSRRTICPLIQSDDALRIPRVILTRLLKIS